MIRRAAALALGLALAGCLTKPLDQRKWFLTETEHYDVWSSLVGDDSARVAVDLERFRTGAEFIWGRTLPAAPVRTRVYAFDDRGIGRPFAQRGERSYLLARQRGDAIVLRTGDGWEGDARVPLKLDYARRLFWSASPGLPPWFEEGTAQVASTLEIRGDGATIGKLQQDHVRRLRESQWIPLRRVLSAPDLRGWSELERELFEAESWALCHYLSFSAERRAESDASRNQFRTLIASGTDPLEAARKAFGDENELQHAVWNHVRAQELDSLTVRIPWTGPRPTTRSLSQLEVREALGSLSLAIGETAQAAGFFEDALAADSRSPRAIAGLAAVRLAEGDPAAAEAGYQQALAAAPDDALVHLDFANLLRARASGAGDPAELASRAREHYQRSIDLDPAIPEPYAGLAASHLLRGEDPAQGVAPARTARTLLPGDPEIQRLGARIALAVGDRETAQREARLLMSRARSDEELDAARSLFDGIDARAARR